jgi:hypothetical protein
MERQRADLDDDDGDAPLDLDALIEAAEGCAATDWERTFCADMRERYTKWRGETRVSESQLAKLRDIARGGGGRAKR